MLDFDEEIKKFQPSLEVEDAEDAIYNNCLLYTSPSPRDS